MKMKMKWSGTRDMSLHLHLHTRTIPQNSEMELPSSSSFLHQKFGFQFFNFFAQLPIFLLERREEETATSFALYIVVFLIVRPTALLTSCSLAFLAWSWNSIVHFATKISIETIVTALLFTFPPFTHGWLWTLLTEMSLAVEALEESIIVIAAIKAEVWIFTLPSLALDLEIFAFALCTEVGITVTADLDWSAAVIPFTAIAKQGINILSIVRFTASAKIIQALVAGDFLHAIVINWTDTINSVFVVTRPPYPSTALTAGKTKSIQDIIISA